jgi:hypothetical protein
MARPTEAVILPPSERRQLQLVPVDASKVVTELHRVSVPKSNLCLVILAYSLGIVGIGINAWFAWNRGTTVIDKGLLSSLGFITEAMAFYLPAQASSLWIQRRISAFCFAVTVCVHGAWLVIQEGVVPRPRQRRLYEIARTTRSSNWTAISRGFRPAASAGCASRSWRAIVQMD